jgi:hypothetical protein
MKKVLVCLVLFAALNAKAQNNYSKGDWFLGAQSTGVGFERLFHNGSSTKFNVGILGGWFFTSKFAIDAAAGINYFKEGNAQGDGTINFGAGIRYYPVNNLFARVGYNGNILWNGDVRSYINAKVGYDIFLSRKVFFEPAIYFEKNISWSGPAKSTGTENILGLSIGIGILF